MTAAPTPANWQPGRRGTAILVAISAAALATGFYMRYGLVEPPSVGLVCDAGAQTTVCTIRHAFIGIFTRSGFGIAAIVTALLALARPGTFLVGATLATGFIGVVLYNTATAAIALSLLPLVLARAAPRREFQPD